MAHRAFWQLVVTDPAENKLALLADWAKHGRSLSAPAAQGEFDGRNTLVLVTVLNERFSMKCPRCVQRVTPGEESCSHCGYSMAVACGFYGEGSVVAEQLMDVESRLTAEERGAIRQVFEDFTAQFPQLFLMMYLGTLPPPASPRQFAFWLLNHAAVPGMGVLLPNEHGLLLVVDPPGGTAVLATGYFLEDFVRQEELDGVLRSAQKELGRAEYPGALRVIAGELTRLLKKRAKEAAKHPETFRRAPDPTGIFPPLVRTGEPVLEEAARRAIEPAIPREVLPMAPEVVKAAPAPAVNEAAPSRKTGRRLKPGARRTPPRR